MNQENVIELRFVAAKNSVEKGRAAFDRVRNRSNETDIEKIGNLNPAIQISTIASRAIVCCLFGWFTGISFLEKKFNFFRQDLTWCSFLSKQNERSKYLIKIVELSVALLNPTLIDRQGFCRLSPQVGAWSFPVFALT